MILLLVFCELLELNRCARMRMDSNVHDSFISPNQSRTTVLSLLLPGHNDNSRQSLDVPPQILKHTVLNMSDALPMR